MMRIRIRKLLFLCLAVPSFILWVADGRAASFDCARAGTRVEKMICADIGLSRSDDQMGKLYLLASQYQCNDPTRLKQEQLRWLKERNACTDAECIGKAYRSRLDALVSLCSDKPRYGHCIDVENYRNCCDNYDRRCTGGKGYTVCERYLRYLNSLSGIPRCDIPIPPGFQRPDWEYLEVTEHLDWAWQAENFAHMGTDEDFRKLYPNFETWKQKFLQEIQSGEISPSMRKTRVKPQGAEEKITILAYTRNREGCREAMENASLSWETISWSYWVGIGYAHFLLPDKPDAPLEIIPGAVNAMTRPKEMLLYAGEPYVIGLGFDVGRLPHIGLDLLKKWYDNPPEDEHGYGIDRLCNFSPPSEWGL